MDRVGLRGGLEDLPVGLDSDVRWLNRRRNAVPISACRYAPNDGAGRADHRDRRTQGAEFN
jgi:hypothetical protein